MAGRKTPLEYLFEIYGRKTGRNLEEEYAQFIRSFPAANSNTICIKARRGRVDQQMEVLKMIESRVNAMQQAESAKEVMAEGGMAAGIANTMLPTGLIDKVELAGMIKMIDKIGREKLEELAAAGGRRDGNVFSRYLHRRKAETV